MGNSQIEKMEFQFQISDPAEFDVVSKELPEVLENMLNSIEKEIPELFLPDRTLVIDRVELNLGTIDLGQFKAQLKENFLFYLIQYLKRELNQNPNKQTAQSILAIKAIYHFLQYGTKPWWINGDKMGIGELIQVAFKKHPFQLIQLVLSCYRNRNAYNRILDNFSETQLVHIFLYKLKYPAPNEKQLKEVKGCFQAILTQKDQSTISYLFKRFMLKLIYNSRKQSFFDFHITLMRELESYQSLGNIPYPLLEATAFYTPTFTSNEQGKKKLIQQNGIDKNEMLFQVFKFYLLNGYYPVNTTPFLRSYQNAESIFQFLLKENLSSTTQLLLQIGKKKTVKDRFLTVISAQLLSDFFALMAPSKKKLLDWVHSVVQQVEADYRPINQTHINIRKSINEITFELFLKDNLHSITDENFIKALFKATAKKYHLSYKKLLQFAIQSSSRFVKRQGVFRFNQLLAKIYTADFPAEQGQLQILRETLAGYENLSTQQKSSEKKEILLHIFKFYLLNGYFPIDGSPFSSSYKNAESVFQYLLKENLSSTTELLLQLGKKKTVKERFLTEISPQLMSGFFGLMAPSKKDLLDWVHSVVQQVEVDYRPINQTHINIRKSINEITFELFLKGDLHSITDENFIKALFKATGKKYRLSYKKLLQFAIQSSSRFVKGQGIFRFNQLLAKVYTADFPAEQVQLQTLRDTLADYDRLPIDGDRRIVVEDLFLSFFRMHTQSIHEEEKAKVWLKNKLATKSKISQKTILSLAQFFSKQFKLNFKTFKGFIDKEKSIISPSPLNRGRYFDEVDEASGQGQSTKTTSAVSKQQAYFVLFSIIGKDHLSSFYQDYTRYGEEILFKSLTAKHKEEFYKYIKLHQFNQEFKDFVLLNAPSWLKLEIINFLGKFSSINWLVDTQAFSKKLTELKWLNLNKSQLLYFVESVFWHKLFDKVPFNREAFTLHILEEALTQHLLSKKFLKDFQVFQYGHQTQAEKIDSLGVIELENIASRGFNDQLEMLFPKNRYTFLMENVLSHILRYQEFPKGHPFEGATADEFKSYSTYLISNNWQIFVKVVFNADPILLRLFLDLISYKDLRRLVEEKLRQEGEKDFAKKTATIVNFIKLNPNKKQLFFKAFLLKLLQGEVIAKPHAKAYVQIFKLITELGLISENNLFYKVDYAILLDKLALPLGEHALFFEAFNRVYQLGSGSSFSPIKAAHLLQNWLPDLSGFAGTGSSESPYVLYRLLITLGFDKVNRNKSHLKHLQNWVSFAIASKEKDYLLALIQIYRMEGLVVESSVLRMRTVLFYAFFERLYLQKRDVVLFLKRLRQFPELIRGIPFGILANMSKSEIKSWSRFFLDINPSSSTAYSDKKWSESLLFIGLKYDNPQGVLPNELSSYQNLFQTLVRDTPVPHLLDYDIAEKKFSVIAQFKPRKEWENYFLNKKMSFFGELEGWSLIKVWLPLYFSKVNTENFFKFIKLYYRSFFKSGASIPQRGKIFFENLIGDSIARNSLAEVYQSQKTVSIFLSSQFSDILSREGQPSVRMAEKLLLSDELLLFFEFGEIPQRFGGIKDFAHAIRKVSGKEAMRLKSLFYFSFKSRRNKKYLYQLLMHVDELWLFGLIHKNLHKELSQINSDLKIRVGIDIFKTLGLAREQDRLFFLVEKWSLTRLNNFSTVELINLVVNDWVELIAPELIQKAFSAEGLPISLQQLKRVNNKLKAILDDGISAKRDEIPEIPEVDYGEGLSIDNAGLILIWPFLGRFFSSLGMLDKDGFKGEKMTERAIQLLQVIATGKVEFEEWDLTLNKLLCGVSPQFPVAPVIELAKEEEMMIDKLMQATIFNWEKMRGTKVETFRETFLMRSGRLYEKENRWELMVETRAYDVLLDTLPWNLAMINLSWMKTRLNVLWR